MSAVRDAAITVLRERLAIAIEALTEIADRPSDLLHGEVQADLPSVRQVARAALRIIDRVPA